MNRLTAEELTHSENYELMETLEHDNLVPFLQIYSKVNTHLMYFFLILAVSIPAIMTFLFFKNMEDNGLDILLGIGHILMAFSIIIILVPIHEYIHSLAYQALGAKETSFYANWRKFYFAAIANKFVISKKEFQIVAFAPFVVIAVLLLSVLPFVSIYWQLTTVTALFIHVITCSGDFAMVNYYIVHDSLEILNFDDKELKTTYFYRLKSK
jgi:hypothetical protein